MIGAAADALKVSEKNRPEMARMRLPRGDSVKRWHIRQQTAPSHLSFTPVQTAGLREVFTMHRLCLGSSAILKIRAPRPNSLAKAGHQFVTSGLRASTPAEFISKRMA
jgi:hypothetical protein